MFPLIFIALFVQIAIICCRNCSRKVPTNYALLAIFTLCETWILSYICTFYDKEIVLLSGVLTCAVTCALGGYAMTTKTDFTICGGLIWIMCIVLLFVSLSFMFFTWTVFWHPLVSGLVLIFYGIFLIYDVQLVAGKGKHKLEVDDYVLGALLIYTDIILIFLEILKVLGRR